MYFFQITGINICVQVVKNKLGLAMKAADLNIEFGKGIRLEAEVLDLACKHGLIEKDGNFYNIGSEVFEDKTEAEEYLSENGGILEELLAVLRKRLFVLKE